EEFIDAKQKEERKAWALIEQGYDGSYNGDAYGSIMYQNENLSVRVSDEFMQAAVEGREWWTRRVVDGKPCDKKDARALLREIAENSHIFRTLGLGYANLGALIMSYGLGYDSDEGRALAGAITAIMTGHAYEQSARMARDMGPFPGYYDARCSGVDKPLAK